MCLLFIYTVYVKETVTITWEKNITNYLQYSSRKTGNLLYVAVSTVCPLSVWDIVQSALQLFVKRCRPNICVWDALQLFVRMSRLLIRNNVNIYITWRKCSWTWRIIKCFNKLGVGFRKKKYSFFFISRKEKGIVWYTLQNTGRNRVKMKKKK